MTSHAAPALATPLAAELLIHADVAVSVSAFEAALQRWRLRLHLSPTARAGVRLPLMLQVDDLQGQRLADVHDAGALTRLSLPPGTCNVTATSGDIRRGYTLTLEPGRSVDLHLNQGTDGL